MNKSAAIDGDYVDLKFIKGRKVAQIHIEIPIEQASKFVEVFGTPLPDQTIPVAIARLVGFKEKLRESVELEKSKRHWNELSRAQQAGIACNELGFWAYLNENHGYAIESVQDAAEAVRERCAVSSRKDLDLKGACDYWDALYDGYRIWLQAPEVAA